MADATWIQARIDSTKAAIVAYEAALLALSTGAQSYTLDTGQSRQTVTKASVGEMERVLGRLEQRLRDYENELAAVAGTSATGASVYIRPGY